MSADNGVYILQTSDGFRVAHAQAIDNIDFFPEGSKEQEAELVLIFGDSEIFKERDSAFLYARDVYDKIEEDGFVEYGICPIHREDTVFPSISKEEAEQILDQYWVNQEKEKAVC